ncbi:MAG TPA: hypothetical protein PKN85_08980 [Syntrophorhabdaceae bacterium]|nr:hypothetical protein [Syntrophorhabdaceae bacterium]
MKIMTGIVHVVCILVVLCVLLTLPGCTGEGEKGSGPQAAKTEPQARQAKAGGFTVPEEGTPAERVRKLWESTGPIMKVDAQANLIDREYQNKRTPLFSVWVTLQGKLSLAPQKDERAQRVIPEVLKFIDDLYGFPGFTEERREKDRETAKKFFDKRYGRLEEEIKALK